MVMPISAQLQTLLAQLQNCYPNSSVCAELLTIHQGQHVVRAMVQWGPTLLATAMAAAPEIETAEDRAKIRVLECLRLSVAPGIPVQPAPERFLSHTSPLPPVSPPVSLGPPVSPNPLGPFPEPVRVEASPVEASEPVTLPSPEQIHPVALMTEGALSTFESALGAFDALQPETEILTSSSSLPPLPPLPDVDLPASEPAIETPVVSGARSSKPEKSTKRKSDAAATATALTTEPIGAEASLPERTDRSEEVMKIGIEMKRLGWSTEQGREYLKRTYGKRSRQELDDAELLDFLRYLENQPSPLQTPF